MKYNSKDIHEFRRWFVFSLFRVSGHSLLGYPYHSTNEAY